MELLLHPFSGEHEKTSGSEVRSFREGLAQAHFTPDWRRATGNPQFAVAPTILIVGDSHVEALQVGDTQTMGSLLERRLRAEGQPWNVLQYGSSGADGPDYVYEARLLESEFPAQTIFLLVNGNDFATTITEAARLVERDGKVLAEAHGPGSAPGHRSSVHDGFWWRKVRESGLYCAVTLRLHLDILPRIVEHHASAQESDAPDQAAPPNTLHLIVRALQQAYGPRLHILYAPLQPFAAHTPLEPQESSLLAECRTLGMACRSLRPRMEEDLVAHHQFARGFSDTQPGVGHLNARGHQLVADELHDWLNHLD
jgi:lysophospholipase L1-like esterase